MGWGGEKEGGRENERASHGPYIIEKMEMENGSILLASQMRHILASLDRVASAADRIQKEA